MKRDTQAQRPKSCGQFRSMAEWHTYLETHCPECGLAYKIPNKPPYTLTHECPGCHHRY